MNKSLSTVTNRVVYYTLKCPEASKRLANLLVTKPDDSIILPFIDHPGPISRELLSRKFGSLTFCDRDDIKRNRFIEHVNRNFPRKNIRVYPEDLFDLSYTIAHNHEAQRKCSDIVEGSWRRTADENHQEADNENNNRACDKRVKLLVPLLQSRYEAGFLRNIYYQMALEIGLCSNTLVDYYFLMSDRQYNYLDAKAGGNLILYRSTTILYNTIFNIHKLDSLDLYSAFGIKLNKIQKTSKINNSAYQQVHIVWLEPNLDVIGNLDSKALLEYRFYVNQIMVKRTGLVSAFVRRWFRYCSQDIAHLGITDDSRAGDLTQDQLYKLFAHLRGKPEYKNSTFVQAAERAEDHILSPHLLK